MQEKRGCFVIKCEKADELIQHYLDLSLSHDQRIQLDRHVDSCSRCRIELHSYKHLLELIEADEEPKLPQNFTQAIMAELPNLEFSGDSRHAYGSGFDAIYPYLKVFGLAVAAVFVIALVNLDHPFNFLGSSQTQREGGTSILAGVHGNLEPQAHGSRDGKGLASGVNDPLAQGHDRALADRLVLKVTGGVVHIRGVDGFQLVQDGESRTLSFRDEIRTGAKASASLEYPGEKIRLALKPGTRLQVARNSLRLFHGNTWIHVVKKGTKFEVRTPNLIAAVRGTVFTVESVATGTQASKGDPRDYTSKVLVFEGRVEVRSATKDQGTVSLTAGQTVSNLGLGLGERVAIEPEDSQPWNKELSELGLDVGAGLQVEDHKPSIQDIEVSPDNH
jgi:hypothetical protein